MYNLIYAALSWPLGELSDRFGRRPLLLAAYLLFAVVYGTLAWRATVPIVIAAFACFGIHSALLEGTQRSLLGELIPHGRRATAYGLYYAVVGAALLPASALAGALWDRFGPRVAFGLDAALALLAAILFVLLVSSAGGKAGSHAHAA
jgi:MFS family permease